MRAQVWSLDFITSVVIFLTAFVVVLFAWNHVVTGSVESRDLYEMQLASLSVSDALVRTAGSPSDWGNESDIKALGLALDENVLNATKLDFFVDLDYDQTRTLMGIGSADFYLELLDLDGNVIRNTSVPVDYGTAEHVIPAERYVLYEGNITKLRLILWE